MIKSILIALGLAKPQRKVKAKLPEGLNKLEVVSAKAWWN